MVLATLLLVMAAVCFIRGVRARNETRHPATRTRD
jgi:hypothetical protein